MRSYLRIQSPWPQLALFFGLLAAGLVFTSFISAFILIAKGISITNIKSLDFNDPHMVNILKLLQAISTITIFLVPGLIFAFITFRYNQLYFFGFHKPSKNNFYLLAILIMFVSIPFVSWLGELNQRIPLAKWMVDMEKDAGKQMDAFLKVRSNADIAINLLIIALLPAICEEACFRGCLQRILIHIFKNPWVGIIVTAILFSAFHMQFEGFFPRMFLGILLGMLFWYSGSLWVNIAAHFFINGIQVIAVLYYPKLVDENPSVPIYAAVISGLLVWGLFVIIKKQSTATFAGVYEFEKVNEHNEFIA
jgi:CAAX protease family protein